MNEQLSGETIAKKRQHKVILILAVSAIIGIVFGARLTLRITRMFLYGWLLA